MRSLLSTLCVTVPPALENRVLAIDTEDYSGVRCKVAEHFQELGRTISDEEMDAGILALKQYYVIALLDPANAHAVSRPLDPFWHAHILHTEKYLAFCDRVVGEYMHHRPLDHARAQDVTAVRRLYDYTLDTLPRLFTHIDERYWPSGVEDQDLICFHKGNADIYQDVQPHRLFEPCAAGAMA